MSRIWNRVAGTGALCVLVGLSLAGCSGRGAGIDFAKLTRPPAWSPSPAPVPDSPANVLRLLEWCYNNRAIAECCDLFTGDFQFVFDPADSTGARYRDKPWSRSEELTSTTHMFVGGGADASPASTITLRFDQNFFVFPDARYSKWDPSGRWHKNIRTQVLLSMVTKDGSAEEISGAVSFYFVRGDSALIPEELRLRGFGPDSSRWYIQRWDDETGHSEIWPRPPVLAPQPASKATWGRIKVLYLPSISFRPADDVARASAGPLH